MASQEAEDTGGGTATEEVDEMATPATKQDLKDAIAEVATGFRESTKEDLRAELDETDAPLTYEEARAAARGGVLQAVAIIAVVLVVGFVVFKLFASSSVVDHDAKYQNKQQYELLTANEPGGGLKGIYYLPPGPYYDRKTTGGEYGVYYVQPEEQTDDAQAMALHLITRAFKHWRTVPEVGAKVLREMIGAPQLIYSDGIPVAALVYYRYVQLCQEGEKG